MRSKIMPFVTAWGHERYVEPFGGGASILIAKPPVGLETYNDLDGAVVDFFRVIADVEMFERFHRRVGLLPYSRELYNEYRATWQDEGDLVERVARWFLVARQSFSGLFGASWGSSVSTTRRGMVMSASRWVSILQMLPEIHARLQRVQIEHADFRDIFRRYDTGSTLFYCDPPYVLGTRRSGGYSCEMSDDDHVDMIDALLRLQGECVLSGYPSEVYAPLDDAWERVDFDVACCATSGTKASGLQGEGATQNGQRRTECLWLSPGVSEAMRGAQIELIG